MHDIKSIRENPDAFDAQLLRRGLAPKAKELLEIDFSKRKKQTKLQALQARRNEIAKQMGAAMRSDPALAEKLKQEAADIKDQLLKIEIGDELAAVAEDVLERELSIIPNLLAADVPEGADESGNQQLRVVGAKPAVADAKDHVALGEALGMMDFERAAKLSGARFVVLRGALAKLERALAAFMLDIHTNEFGYTEHQVPYLVKDAALYGTGQLPKFEEDLFVAPKDIKESTRELMAIIRSVLKNPDFNDGTKEIREEIIERELINVPKQDNFYLIPTSEVSLTNLVANEIIDATQLPMRLTAHTPCFRSEAGSAGRDTRGMIRQHQFSKVELVSITTPEQSEAEHERMLSAAEEVLKRLGLHYRVMLLCAGDTGFSARKTYDIEVWLPGQQAFREISSISNCGDFQARRMKARYRAAGAKDTQFVHTLNGSGLAVGRCMVALLENYQQPDGSIKIPDVLVPYVGGMKVISVNGE